MNLGERIRQMRESRGWTQNDLAALLQVSGSTVNRYELNLRKPDPDMLAKLAEVLSVSVDYLLLGSSGAKKANKTLGPAPDIALEWPEGYRILSRGVRKMDTKEKNRLIELIKIAFPEDFPDEDIPRPKKPEPRKE